RSQHLWNQERRLGTFQSWLMTHQSPARTAATTVVMAGVLGLGMSALPIVISLVLAPFLGLAGWQILLNVLLIPLCALLGAAIGAAVFFVSFGLSARGLHYPGLVVLGPIAIGLWLPLGGVDHGWHRGSQEHP